MFKAQVLRRSFSLWRRTPPSQVIRSATHNGHETIQIQRVRIRKPFFTRSRLIGALVTTSILYAFDRWLDGVDLEDEEEEASSTPRLRRDGNEEDAEGDEDGEDEDDEEEEDDALLFFPTGFSRPKPRTFYRGSDPEWQDFVRLAPDQERTDRIRGELVTLIRDLAMKNPGYKFRLGNINPTAGTSWVEIKFPDGPPIEYERPGIVITEDLSVRRATRDVDEMHHQRLSNALVPSAVANSLYADSKAKAEKGWSEFRKYIGWEDKNARKWETFKRIMDPPLPPAAPNSTAPTAPTAASATTPGSAAPPPSSGDTPAQSGSSSTPSSPSKDENTSNEAYEKLGLSLPSPTPMTLDLSTFRRNWMKQRKPMKIQPPRGTFMVSGLVQVMGDKAYMTVDVTGIYDPKQGRYVALMVKLRSVTDFKQFPRGGP